MSQPARTAIVGGLVVNESWSDPATVLIGGGKVVGLLSPDETIPGSVERVISADGDWVIPGGVDPHCHVETTMGEYTTRDNYSQASRAALWGGTTTIIDFAIPTPGQSPWDAVSQRLQMAKTSTCDTALHGCVTQWADDVPDQLEAMARIGIRTVKMFTTYRGSVMASSDTILQVMRHLARLGGIAYVHAESNTLVEAAQQDAALHRHLDASHHSQSRPEYTEAAAVAEVLSIAEALRSHAYFVHQSTPLAVSLIRRARSRGAHVYSETCPHYLLLDADRYAERFPEKYVCCPPLRTSATVQGLRHCLRNGDIQTVGSDHNCFDLEQKLSHREDVRRMPNGLPGVELRLPIMFSQAEQAGDTQPQELVRLLSANPARLNGMYPRKGVIAPGSDADIVILSRREPHTVEAGALHMQTDYSPFEGFSLTVVPRVVITAGVVAIDGGEMTLDSHLGAHIPASPVDPVLLC